MLEIISIGDKTSKSHMMVVFSNPHRVKSVGVLVYGSDRESSIKLAESAVIDKYGIDGWYVDRVG